MRTEHQTLAANSELHDAAGLGKRVATLRARAALAGFELVEMADGSFVIARWTLTRALANLAAVEAFLAQVGAR
jgi:hypothetical protein